MPNAILKSFLLLAMAIMLAGCSESPRSVAVDFMNELSKGNATRAKELSTSQTAQMIDLIVGTGQLPKGPFKYVSEEKISEAKYRVLVRDGDGKEDWVEVIRIDGKWKVALSK